MNQKRVVLNEPKDRIELRAEESECDMSRLLAQTKKQAYESIRKSKRQCTKPKWNWVFLPYTI